jgi:hypothetical protein
MSKHNVSTAKHTQLQTNIKFAKQLFNILNVHDKDDGILLSDIAESFIALGLAIDLDFVKRIMKLLAPSKFSNNESFETNMLSMKEFTLIFQADKHNELMAQII